MRLLLDTHIWLWLQYAPERLGPALPAVEDPDNELLLSAASSWEIAIKYALGKFALPEPPMTYVADRIASSGIIPLPVQHSHDVAISALPSHHRDPFDRMLVVQSLAERASIVTADPALRAYKIDLVWAGWKTPRP